MKIISYNIALFEDNIKHIVEFLSEQNADIICLQEVSMHLDDTVLNMYKTKQYIDSKFSKKYPYRFFNPSIQSNHFKYNDNFIKKYNGFTTTGEYLLSRFPILHGMNAFVYKDFEYRTDWSKWPEDDLPHAVQVAEIKCEHGSFQVANYHGIYRHDKLDDKHTINASHKIIDICSRKEIPTIICGDFNLLPDTESIQIIEKDYQNLSKRFEIKSTIPDRKGLGVESGQVLDYIFVSDDIKIQNFKTINTKISDHLPLSLDFHIGKQP